MARHDIVYEQQDGPHVATGADILLRLGDRVRLRR
jgi:hypothetical protein